jgi:hypothetical protein
MKQQSIKDAACSELANASVVLTNPPPLKGQKVERGIIQTPSPVSVALLFEQFPIWLLTLAPNQVRHLAIMGHARRDVFVLSCGLNGLDLKLIDAALANLGWDVTR